MPRLTKTKAKETGSAVSSNRSSVSGASHLKGDAAHEASSSSPSSAGPLTKAALEVVRQMLLYLDPAAASLLPVDEMSATRSLHVPIPISEWNVLYSTPASSAPSGSKDTSFKPSIQVLSYPTSEQNLFCVRSVLPDISARQFWTLMAESGNRHLWDTTTQEGGNHRFFSSELPSESPEHTLAHSLAARLEYLRFGSIFMVAKPRDMVLLSADVRLPPTSASALRLVSACRSEVDPAKPPVKGYTRYDLGVGGFMVEELGTDGTTSTARTGKACQVTQLSNLGSAASWVPASVVKMVAQTMVPRSVALISKAAISITVPEPLRTGVVPDDVDPKEEIVHKGRERWSKARILPSQVGEGILGRSRPEPQSTKPGRPTQGSSQDELPETSVAAAASTTDVPTPTPPAAPESMSTPLADTRHISVVEDPAGARPPLQKSHATARSSASPSTDNTATTELCSTRRSSSTQSGSTLASRVSLAESDGANFDTEVTASSQDTSMAESRNLSVASKASQERLRLRNGDEVGQRLNRISMALQAKCSEEQDMSFSPPTPAASHLRGSIAITESPEGQTAHSRSANGDDQDEVNELVAEALSISLSSPQLQSHFAAYSPDRSTTRQLSPSLLRSPGAREARREASELSAILLAGSDALISALAPGARERLPDGDSGAMTQAGPLRRESCFSSPTRGRERPVTLSNASRSSAATSRSSAVTRRKKSVRPALASSASFSRAITQTTSAHALHFPGSQDTSLEEGGRDVAMTSWKNALNSTPYALELGKMAMLWTSEASQAGKSPSPGRGAEEAAPLPSLPSSLHGASPAVRALRSASGFGSGRLRPPTPGRSFSSPAHQTAFAFSSTPTASSSRINCQSSLETGDSLRPSVRIPAPESERRKASRENYKDNPKLMTSPVLG
ncbi:hypothetical protein BCV69DRAFT_13585 [Microstroma glucosiphilum]|uniref:START domain-containing protein n=1 Tax=Pseudomicrostroma glucosiphilum TaxID=1684307 RepID=A0A316UIZ4_9BASI|nr:hypothetical protein BCV69DRAFT_13585 [Pseudomicrostroma glucosiphilum]PWN23913.1 hypothetical protein BCV69DRAFT_13585 [Pseudomicrostroma glucosiphilum]